MTPNHDNGEEPNGGEPPHLRGTLYPIDRNKDLCVVTEEETYILCYGGPMNHLQDGTWHRTVPSLHRTNGLTEGFAGETELRFAGDLRSENGIIFRRHGEEIRIRNTGYGSVLGDGESFERIAVPALMYDRMQDERSLVLRDGALDLESWLLMTREGLNHEQVITSSFVSGARLAPSGWLCFEFQLECDQNLRLCRGGGEAITSLEGEAVGVELWRGNERIALIPAPVAMDDNEILHSGWIRAERTAEGLRLLIGISAAWLAEPDRAFPVRLDPTIYGKDSRDGGITYLTGVWTVNSVSNFAWLETYYRAIPLYDLRRRVYHNFEVGGFWGSWAPDVWAGPANRMYCYVSALIGPAFPRVWWDWRGFNYWTTLSDPLAVGDWDAVAVHARVRGNKVPPFGIGWYWFAVNRADFNEAAHGQGAGVVPYLDYEHRCVQEQNVGFGGRLTIAMLPSANPPYLSINATLKPTLIQRILQRSNPAESHFLGPVRIVHGGRAI